MAPSARPALVPGSLNTDIEGSPVLTDDELTTDIPGWVSPDDCTILVSARRNGHYDLFVAQRPK